MDATTARLAELKKKRETYIAAIRENGFEEGITNLLTELYPDNAHFIYELLQNAEDTRAGLARFILSEDGIRFEHDGKRLFDLNDIESITSIGTSTKRNDPTTIGKFGVGFKAVFAYTRAPEIHSGDIHFRIRDLVVPEPLPKPANSEGTTFRFPFDHSKKSAGKATEEIERGLRALADNTLLFLRHIREVEYQLPCGQKGKLARIDADEDGVGQRIEIQTITPGETGSLSRWLRYRKEVLITDEAGRSKACEIAIAFRLEPNAEPLESGGDEEKKSHKKSTKAGAEWRIAPCQPGQVSIFFPAEKETSNLHFHLHAPFASTVARDSVRECEANGELRNALGQLVVEALADIRDRGLLTVSFLGVLPNAEDGLPTFYEPIRAAILEAFRQKDLLPTRSGVHLSAQKLYRGPVDISSVIEDDDLSLLTNYNPPLWAANAPQKGQREDKFLDSVALDVWSWAQLKEAFQATERDGEQRTKVEEWLLSKTDAWLMRFYALMESCHANTRRYYYEPDPLNAAWRSLKGIRVATDKDAPEHVVAGDAYFPQTDSGRQGKSPDVPAKIKLVKPEVYEKGRAGEGVKKAARDFLERIGVREYNERAEIERRLDWYAKAKGTVVSESHYRDIRAFVSFLRKNPTETELFEGRPILLASNAPDEEPTFTEPEDVYLDDPYEPTGLGGLAEIHRKLRLHGRYLENLGVRITGEDFVSFAKSIGVLHTLPIVEADARDNVLIKTRYSGRRTANETNVDWSIEDIEEYLEGESEAASRMIWNALIKAGREVAVAKYRPNQSWGVEKAESQLIQYLKSCAWISDTNGIFRSPQEMTREMLPKAFPYDDRNGLLTAIGFEDKAREASAEYKARDAEAKKFGFESAKELEEALELLKAKREGRIREIPQGNLLPPGENGQTSQAGSPITTNGESGVTSGGGSQNGEVSPAPSGGAMGPQVASESATVPPVLRRISSRVCNPPPPSAPLPTTEEEQEPGDNDDYTPATVDYSGRIARAEERSALEIARLEREQELLNKAVTLPRYSYGWFLALLELECLASSEKNADGKTITISFGRLERDALSPKTIILKEPSRFIPQSIEEVSGVRLDLEFRDGNSGKLHIDSFTAKEFSLHGKLKSVEELHGIKAEEVVEARIAIQNPSFLLEALLERFRALHFDEAFDMKANLTPDIEFVFGPPGTGKTTHLAESVLIPLMDGRDAAKVLVLTPTNKAADVLTMRIVEKVGTAASCRNWLIRFGTSADDRIEAAGLWRDRAFDIHALAKSVTITTIARFAYDGFLAANGKLHEINWDLIVVDEASMISLVNIVYPLYRRQPQKFIIGGDPFEIEPIVAVEQWKDENIYSLVGLDQPGSFVQPVTGPHSYPVTNLETQYRSIPEIGEVFSRFTYNGCLKHHRPTEALRPLRVDDLALEPLNLIKFPVSKYESIYRARRLSSGTPYQTYSALFTFEFARWLMGQIQQNHAGEPPFRIGIIAPYRAQANLLSRLVDAHAVAPGVQIQVGTIHGFQGDECDIIIAVLNPPERISASPRMFLNKQNILNVAISRARDYLFLVMPDEQTEGIVNLRKVKRIEHLVRKTNAYSEHASHEVEGVMFGNPRYLEENTFSTGHQMVNVYLRPERYYEVRSDDSAIDVQIHEAGRGK